MLGNRNELLSHQRLIAIIDRADTKACVDLFSTVADRFGKSMSTPYGITPAMLKFVNALGGELANRLQANLLLATGKFERSDAADEDVLRRVGTILAEQIPFAGGVVANVVEMAVDKKQAVANKKQEQCVEIINRACPTTAEKERFYLSLAILIATSLQINIESLTPENSKIFINYACNELERKLKEKGLIEITSAGGFIPQKDVMQLNLHGLLLQMYLLFFMPPKNSLISRLATSIMKGSLKTQGEDEAKLNAKGLLYSTGLRVLQKDNSLITISAANTRPEKYGYRYGTEKDKLMQSNAITEDENKYLKFLDDAERKQRSSSSSNANASKANEILAWIAFLNNQNETFADIIGNLIYEYPTAATPDHALALTEQIRAYSEEKGIQKDTSKELAAAFYQNMGYRCQLLMIYEQLKKNTSVDELNSNVTKIFSEYNLELQSKYHALLCTLYELQTGNLTVELKSRAIVKAASVFEVGHLEEVCEKTITEIRQLRVNNLEALTNLLQSLQALPTEAKPGILSTFFPSKGKGKEKAVATHAPSASTQIANYTDEKLIQQLQSMNNAFDHYLANPKLNVEACASTLQRLSSNEDGYNFILNKVLHSKLLPDEGKEKIISELARLKTAEMLSPSSSSSSSSSTSSTSPPRIKGSK